MKRRRKAPTSNPMTSPLRVRDLNATFIGARILLAGRDTANQYLSVQGCLSDLERHPGGVEIYLGGNVYDVGDEVVATVVLPQ